MSTRPVPAIRPQHPRRPRRSGRALGWMAALLSLCGLAAPARADVIVVDPQGGFGDQLLLDALGQAQDGDILLVKPGDYVTLFPQAYPAGFRSLTLIADGAGAPIVLPGLWISSLPEGDTVRVIGFELRPQETSSDRPGLGVNFCDGDVVVEDCTLVGASAPAAMPFLAAGAGLAVSNSSSVVVARCIVQGGDAGPPWTDFTFAAAPGVRLSNASAALFDCTVTGGRGGDGDTVTLFGEPDGGDGVFLLDGSIVVSGGSLQGGDEGDSTVIAAQPGSGLAGNGGSSDDEARLRDVIVTAGQVNGIGVPAPDIDLAPADLVIHPAAARSLALPAPLREAQPASMTLGGLQGDIVFVLASLQADFVVDDLRQAVLALEQPVTFVVVATITDPGGQLGLAFTIPQLPPAVDGTVVGLQAVHFGSDGVTLGAPAGAYWIDGSF